MIIYHFFGQKTLMAPWDLQTNIKKFFPDIPNPTVSDSQPPCRPYPGCSFPPSAFGHTGAPAIPTHRLDLPALRHSSLPVLPLPRLHFPLPALAMRCCPSSRLSSSTLCEAFPGPGHLTLPLISYNPPSVSTAHWKFLSHDV